MKELVFLLEAEDELFQSVRYYERQKRGLGRDFLAEVTSSLARVREYPESASMVMEGVRAIRVCRFPFDLVYQVERDRI